MRRNATIKVEETLRTLAISIASEICSIHTQSDKLEAQHTNELEDMRKTLSSQENMVECQRQDMCRLRSELEERNTELTSLTEQCRRMEEEMTANLRQQIDMAEKEAKEVAIMCKLLMVAYEIIL